MKEECDRGTGSLLQIQALCGRRKAKVWIVKWTWCGLLFLDAFGVMQQECNVLYSEEIAEL